MIFETFEPKKKKIRSVEAEDSSIDYNPFGSTDRKAEEVSNDEEDSFGGFSRSDSLQSLSLVRTFSSSSAPSSLTDRYKNLLFQLEAPSDSISKEIVPETPRFQKSNICSDYLQNLFENRFPLWTSLTVTSNLDSFRILESMKGSRFKMWKFSILSALSLLDGKENHLFSSDKIYNDNKNNPFVNNSSNVASLASNSSTSELKNKIFISSSLSSSPIAFFYYQYNAALKDCMKNLASSSSTDNDSSSHFYLVYELSLFHHHHDNKKLLHYRKENIFSYCLYQRSHSRSFKTINNMSPTANSDCDNENDNDDNDGYYCFVLNLKNSLFSKLTLFPLFRYRLLTEENKDFPSSSSSSFSHRQNDQRQSLSAYGDYENRLKGTSFIILGKLSVDIWNCFLLQDIHMKLFTHAATTSSSSTSSSSSSSTSTNQHQLNLSRLKVIIPTILSDFSFEYSVPDPIHCEIKRGQSLKRKYETNEKQLCFSGFISRLKLQEVISLLLLSSSSSSIPFASSSASSSASSIHNNNKRKREDLFHKFPVLPLQISKKKPVETEQKEEKQMTKKQSLELQKKKQKEKERIALKLFTSSKQKLINPFSFEIAKEEKLPVLDTSASLLALTEEQLQEQEIETIDVETDEFFHMKLDPVEMKLHFITKDILSSASSALPFTSSLPYVKLIREIDWSSCSPHSTDSDNLESKDIQVTYETKPVFGLQDISQVVKDEGDIEV
jgi:hypothetical protein